VEGQDLGVWGPREKGLQGLGVSGSRVDVLGFIGFRVEAGAGFRVSGPKEKGSQGLGVSGFKVKGLGVERFRVEC
jgi:hypothetical protein